MQQQVSTEGLSVYIQVLLSDLTIKLLPQGSGKREGGFFK
jgi:hypothetical protein